MQLVVYWLFWSFIWHKDNILFGCLFVSKVWTFGHMLLLFLSNRISHFPIWSTSQSLPNSNCIPYKYLWMCITGLDAQRTEIFCILRGIIPLLLGSNSKRDTYRPLGGLYPDMLSFPLAQTSNWHWGVQGCGHRESCDFSQQSCGWIGMKWCWSVESSRSREVAKCQRSWVLLITHTDFRRNLETWSFFLLRHSLCCQNVDQFPNTIRFHGSVLKVP